MPTSRRSCAPSPTLSIEVGPSRQLAAVLLALTLLAPVSLMLSDLPHWPAGLLAAGAATHGLHRVHLELRRPAVHFRFRADGTVHVGGQPVERLELAWRGPLACLRWIERGRWRRLVVWPDVLGPAGRRELRLWAYTHRADARTPAVAP